MRVLVFSVCFLEVSSRFDGWFCCVRIRNQGLLRILNIFELLPSNRTLKIMLSNHLGGEVKMRESVFGALITVVGVKADCV